MALTKLKNMDGSRKQKRFKMLLRYTGCSDEQAKWGRCKDPRPFLKEGEIYELSSIEEHTWHTLYFIKGYEDKGGFNSVCFERL